MKVWMLSLVLASATLQAHGWACPRRMQEPEVRHSDSSTPQASEPQPDRPLHMGAGVKPPVVVFAPDPHIPEEVRGRGGFNGSVTVYCWVEPDGTPSHVRVAKGFGNGLDEAAVEAVKKYRFKPATKDGLPVKVDIYMDVHFVVF